MARQTKTTKPPVMARILAATVWNGTILPCDSLVAADESVIAALVRDGAADASQETVAYRLNAGVEPILLTSPEVLEVKEEILLPPATNDEKTNGNATGNA